MFPQYMQLSNHCWESCKWCCFLFYFSTGCSRWCLFPAQLIILKMTSARRWDIGAVLFECSTTRKSFSLLTDPSFFLQISSAFLFSLRSIRGGYLNQLNASMMYAFSVRRSYSLHTFRVCKKKPINMPDLVFVSWCEKKWTKSFLLVVFL